MIELHVTAYVVATISLLHNNEFNIAIACKLSLFSLIITKFVILTNTVLFLLKSDVSPYYDEAFSVA